MTWIRGFSRRVQRNDLLPAKASSPQSTYSSLTNLQLEIIFMKRYTLLAVVLLTFSMPIAFAEEMAGHNMPMPAAKTTTPPPANSMSETVSAVMPAPTADNMQNLLLLMQEIVKMMSSITERLNLMSATTTMTMPSSSTGMVMSPLQARKQEMLTLMQKIQQTSDPATRQKLLQEHQVKMQEVMNMLNGMMESQMQMTSSASPDMAMKDDMKMDDMKMMKDDMKMMKGDMMGGGKKGEMKRHKLMEQRLNDMQELLNQMLQHQAQASK